MIICQSHWSILTWLCVLTVLTECHSLGLVLALHVLLIFADMMCAMIHINAESRSDRTKLFWLGGGGGWKAPCIPPMKKGPHFQEQVLLLVWQKSLHFQKGCAVAPIATPLQIGLSKIYITTILLVHNCPKFILPFWLTSTVKVRISHNSITIR